MYRMKKSGYTVSSMFLSIVIAVFISSCLIFLLICFRTFTRHHLRYNSLPVFSPDKHLIAQALNSQETMTVIIIMLYMMHNNYHNNSVDAVFLLKDARASSEKQPW